MSSSIEELIPSIRVALLFATYGRLDALLSLGYDCPCEDFYEIFWEMIGVTMGCVYSDFIEEYEINSWYFSDECIMEYYRLCRVYGSAHRMKLKDNPYMREAAGFVESSMDFGSGYGYGWALQTKIGHRWASGIVFRSDGYFNAEFQLLAALLEI